MGIFKTCIVIWCVTVNAETKQHTDEFSKYSFFADSFGETWGYYLSWIFSSSPTIVFPAKQSVNTANLRRHSEDNRSVCPSTCRSEQSDKICVTKLAAMVLCFGIFGIMVSLPQWRGEAPIEILPKTEKHISTKISGISSSTTNSRKQSRNRKIMCETEVKHLAMSEKSF